MATSENLTRSECARRVANVSNVAYRVELDLAAAGGTSAAATFTSTTTIQFDSAKPSGGTWVDLMAESVQSIVCNGVELDAAAAWDGARIQLPPLRSANTVEIVAQCRYMHTGEGLHRFVDPVDEETYLYTQFEVADARRVYPCFEQPDLKATWQLTVTAPSHWQVISNSPTPTPAHAGARLKRWEFDATPRISTYITAIVAGPYHCVRDTYEGPNGTYPLGLFCRASLANHLDSEEIFTVTKQGFACFEEAFGTAYPFAKYDQVFVPEFNAGAMENAACVTFLEDYVFRSRVTHAAYETRANTILHEMAHMWFGDLVTMHWWDDLWLNESFAEWAASYASVKATRYTEAWTTFLNQRKTWAYRQDQLPSTHPIAANMIDLDTVRVSFDGITYAKGAAALRQLVAWVGEEAFLQGIRAYFAKHAWGNTRLIDLFADLSQASGRDLSDWAEHWLQTSGVNLLRPDSVVTPDGIYGNLLVTQEPPLMPAGIEPILRNHRVGVGLYRHGDHGLVRTRHVELDVTGAASQVTELVGEPVADLLLLNDGDLTFAKIRLDERSRRTAITAIEDLDDSLARALIFGSFWDMTRDAELSTGDYLSLVLSGLQREPDIGVVQQILRQLRSAIDLFADLRHRDDYVDRLAAGARVWLEEAAPGSDHQLAFARTLAAIAVSHRDLQLLDSLLAGTHQIPGLIIDTDLRWALLKRLVILGRAGETEILAELLRDDTATGRRHAQEARCQIPTAQAKDWAWQIALHDADVANHALAATIAGIMVPEQRDLLRPHVEEYFQAIPGLMVRRTPEMAQNIIAGLFPSLLVEPETITRTERFFANHPDLDPATHRLVAESLDGVLRAMRCQERDTR